jgi:dihydroorotase
MSQLIGKHINLYLDGQFVSSDIRLDKDGILFIEKQDFSSLSSSLILDGSSYYFMPGFIDVHVHLREPGFSYKETIESGTAAAAHGGYTDICAMPNLNPVPDCPQNLAIEEEMIQQEAKIRVHPYGAITKGQKGQELADLAGIAQRVVAFSDDGHGVQSSEMMERAMRQAKALGKIVAAHCEVNDLLQGGYIHAGEYARSHGHRGICSASEYQQIDRDLNLAAKTGCAYHVCHISAKESVELIRQAKKTGVDVSCETGPHYLTLCDQDLQEDGRFKMNPPLRSKADQEALIEGIADGTIDMIATDHAPHSAEEKSRGLEKSAMGIVGLETAFPILYTNFVKTGIWTLKQLVDLFYTHAKDRFLIGGEIVGGRPANGCLWDLQATERIDPNTFLTKGRATPFAGAEVTGKCLLTLCNGKISYQNSLLGASNGETI